MTSQKTKMRGKENLYKPRIPSSWAILLKADSVLLYGTTPALIPWVYRSKTEQSWGTKHQLNNKNNYKIITLIVVSKETRYQQQQQWWWKLQGWDTCQVKGGFMHILIVEGKSEIHIPYHHKNKADRLLQILDKYRWFKESILSNLNKRERET